MDLLASGAACAAHPQQGSSLLSAQHYLEASLSPAVSLAAEWSLSLSVSLPPSLSVSLCLSLSLCLSPSLSLSFCLSLLQLSMPLPPPSAPLSLPPPSPLPPPPSISLSSPDPRGCSFILQNQPAASTGRWRWRGGDRQTCSSCFPLRPRAGEGAGETCRRGDGET